jgi:hypothetical protein
VAITRKVTQDRGSEKQPAAVKVAPESGIFMGKTLRLGSTDRPAHGQITKMGFSAADDVSSLNFHRSAPFRSALFKIIHLPRIL